MPECYHTLAGPTVRRQRLPSSLFLGTAGRRFGKREDQDLLACDRGYVVVHADEFHAHGLFHDRLQPRTAGLDFTLGFQRTPRIERNASHRPQSLPSRICGIFSARVGCKLETRTHMGKCAPHVSCGDEISILSGKCKLENSHPHGKTRTHVSCGDEISSCRRHVQVENSHPHGKTRTHMGKLAPTWENSQHV